MPKTATNLIDLKASPDFRDELSADAIERYRQRYENNLPMDPISLFPHPKRKGYFLCADGRHRLAALELLKRTECDAEIKLGNEDECWRAAAKANTRHGVPWGSKAKMVKAMIRRWPTKTHREIADFADCSHTYVDQIFKNALSTLVKKVATVASKMPEAVRPQQPPGGDGTSEKPLTPTEKPLPQKEPDRLKDAMGYFVPDACRYVFDHSYEIRAYLKAANDWQGALRQLKMERDEKNDATWRRFDWQGAQRALDDLKNTFDNQLPQIVCPRCQGYGEKLKCTFCAGRGAISKLVWDKPVVTKEDREARAQQILSQQNHRTKGPE